MKFYCKNCGCEAEKKDNRSVFCSRSCSATWNNQKRPSRIAKFCIYCNGRLSRNSQKYCSNKCQNTHKRLIKINNGTACLASIKRYLQDNNNSCKICGLSNIWNNQPLVLVLDHIDGNSSNNDLDNLRLVCPNCDSQLPTFKSRNKGNGRHYRRERYANGQSY